MICLNIYTKDIPTYNVHMFINLNVLERILEDMHDIEFCTVQIRSIVQNIVRCVFSVP